MVVLEGPKMSLTLPGTQDVLEGDQEAQDVLAYSRSYAGKLEEERESPKRRTRKRGRRLPSRRRP